MLHLKVVFAQRPHAQINAIDTSAALAYPGVVAVLTAADVPFNAFGLVDHDQPVLCDTKVRFEGDKVALVVAESKQAAQIAAGLVRVDYTDLPVISGIDAALADAAALVHAAHGSNILFQMPIRKGDLATGFAEADTIVEAEFETTWQEHAFLQPEAGIAYIDEQGRVVIETAGQWLHEDRRQLAAMLQLPEDQVVVKYAAIGGAFGGREDLSIQHVLVLAAWKLRRPVALVWNREESMIGHHKRHPMRFCCRWGARRDGTLTAVQATVYADGGAYASTSQEVLKCAVLFASGPYEVANIHVDGYALYTNNVPSGAFRGFGSPQAHFAAEQMATRMAHALGMDPIAFRQKNLYREGSIEPTGQPLPAGVSIRPVFERAVAEMEQRRQKVSLPEHLRRGWGVACGIKNVGYSFGYPEQSTAMVELSGSATIEQAVVRVGVAEVGQGTHLAMRQIAAATLGIAPEQITMITDDSSAAPNAGSASASRLTFMAGRAVHDAAQAALLRWNDEERPAVATIQYRAPTTTPCDPLTGYGKPNYCYGYVAQAVEVEVNTLTGQVQVLQIISVNDVGKAINKQQVEAQIEGCLAQALGYALLENMQARNGRLLTSHFSNYLLPTILDMPTEVVPIILELSDPHGPYGARGMSEMPLVPLAPAIASAIHDAVGVWVTQQPLTPERVLAALGNT
jgi:CO/xanthine dehydrogenase Mo-binding subunit